MFQTPGVGTIHHSIFRYCKDVSEFRQTEAGAYSLPDHKLDRPLPSIFHITPHSAALLRSKGIAFLRLMSSSLGSEFPK